MEHLWWLHLLIVLAMIVSLLCFPAEYNESTFILVTLKLFSLPLLSPSFPTSFSFLADGAFFKIEVDEPPLSIDVKKLTLEIFVYLLLTNKRLSFLL